jgi:hypothetical protein
MSAAEQLEKLIERAGLLEGPHRALALQVFQEVVFESEMAKRYKQSLDSIAEGMRKRAARRGWADL